MRPRIPETLRSRVLHARGWLIPATLLALAPKCLLCLAAYAGVGAALGLSGPEICGASSDAREPLLALFALGGVTYGVTRLCIRARRRR